jgi:hypothetical protein
LLRVPEIPVNITAIGLPRANVDEIPQQALVPNLVELSVGFNRIDYLPSPKNPLQYLQRLYFNVCGDNFS